MSEPRPFQSDRGAGEFVVGDELPGSGPAYVFVHGLGSVRAGEKSTSLLAHAGTLGRAFLRYDQRGHGESSGRIGLTRVSDLIGDLVHLLGRTGPAIVVGSSLGGLVGAYAAVARPDLVRALALLAPALGLLRHLDRRLDPQGRLWTREGSGFRVEPEVLREAMTLPEDTLPQRLHVPTLVVHGTDDDVIPWRASERFFAAIAHPRKRFWLVPGGDHRLNTFAAAIWQHVDELVAESSGVG
ncbi:MAG: alpha/beta fold hydrolase [Planctomycetes bacterium]|nr:alpha/beta fold hydrolase [Planctomycetota bacterium]